MPSVGGKDRNQEGFQEFLRLQTVVILLFATLGSFED
jgi:hypothetical protein